MELRVLRYFLAVAQYKNITHAAQKLLVSQPTLSKQLADLEAELGVKLFIRGHRSITLTDEGEYLRARANEIVRLADQTVANIHADQVISGMLTIGAGESIGMQRIIQVVGKIIADYPDVKLRLVSGNAEQMENQLNHGMLDFAVLMGDRPLADYHYLQLPETDTWGVVMRKDSPLVAKQVITPRDLLGYSLVMSEQGMESRRFQEWWGNLGSRMKVIGTYTLVFNALLLVQSNNALMITFDHLINSPTNNQLTFRPLSPQLQDPITIVWKRNTVLSKVAQLFLSRLKATL